MTVVAFPFHAPLMGFESQTLDQLFSAGSRNAASISQQLLSTDPVGSTTVTFAGVNAGSEIRVYLPDGSEAAGVESCAADQVLTWPVYVSGSPSNTVRVVVVNTAYKIKEFNYAVTLGNQSLPIQQEPDTWYSNP